MSNSCKICGNENKDTSLQYCEKCGCDLETGLLFNRHTLPQGTKLDGRYEIKALVKSGGMGAVYSAYDLRFNKKLCAVKEMLNLSSDPERQQYLIERFKKEAAILNDLRHPNLPVVNDYFIEGGTYYLVMDFIEGKDLDSIKESYGENVGIPQELVIDWSIQILQALEYLHNQPVPIVYRDLKPGNVMIRSSDKRAILIDFGIARTVNPDSKDTKTIIGTPGYSPEELYQGKPEPRTDIYSLGATMHCLLTGMEPIIPFYFEPIYKINDKISEELNDIVMHALEMKAEDRYKDAKEMRIALENFRDGIKPGAGDKSLTVETPVTTKIEVDRTMTVETAVTTKIEKSESEPAITVKMKETEDSRFPQITTDMELDKTIPPEPFITTKMDSLTERGYEPALTVKMPEVKTSLIERAGTDRETKGGSLNFIIIGVAGLIVMSILAYIFVPGILSSMWLNKAIYLDNQKNYKEAISYYDKVLNSNPKSSEALNGKKISLKNMGDESLSSGRYDDAIEYYDKALAIDSKYSDGLNGKKKVFLTRGDEFLSDKKYNEALQNYDYALKLDSSSKEALSGKKKAFFTMGNEKFDKEQYDDATKYYDKALELDAKYVDALMKKGMIFGRNKMYEKAIFQYNKVLKIDPANHEAMQYMGDTYGQNANYDKALEYYNKCLKLNPLNVKVLNNKGYILVSRNNKSDEALDCFDRSLKIEPKDAKVWSSKGYILFNQEKYKAALECYNKALDIDPLNTGAKNIKAYILQYHSDKL